MKISRAIYTGLLWLAWPLVHYRLRQRARKQPEYLEHVEERFGRYDFTFDKPVIWLHAVSVGETRAAVPLVKKLFAQFPQHQILLTHMTPTGRAASAELFCDDVKQVYLPYDYPFAVEKFLAHFKPRIGIVMETEIWPNLFAACADKKIPLLLVNARLSEKSAARYRFAKPLARDALASLQHTAAQTQDDAQRLRELGANTISVSGNMKFDVSVPAEMTARGGQMREQFGAQRPVFLCASTRDGEESQLIDYIEYFDIPKLLVIIVPRHPQRFSDVANLIQQRGIKMQRRSENKIVEADTRILLGDSMGELFAYYTACDVAFIGGSLLPLGGQNLIEACAVGKPVIVGPHTFNFTEAVNNAVACGAAIQVEDAKALANSVTELFNQPERRKQMSRAALTFCEAHRGATERTMEVIVSTLK